MQAEQEMLRVHERMSRVGSVLSACSLLDAATATVLPLSAGDRTSHSSRDCDQMMRDIEDKFIRLRVSPSSKLSRLSRVAAWRTGSQLVSIYVGPG